MSYNYEMYAPYIKIAIPDIDENDLKWLCNKSANIYRSLKDNCVDNYRVSIGPDKSNEYLAQQNNGCCGSCDRLVKNPKTGNEFWVGFNYGH